MQHTNLPEGRVLLQPGFPCRNTMIRPFHNRIKRFVVVKEISRTLAAASGGRAVPRLLATGSTDSERIDVSTVDLERVREALLSWKDRYHVCIIPKSVKGDEAKYLSTVMKALRKQKHLLSDTSIQELQDAGMIWSRPKTVESKWFANFHVAREYLEEQRDIGASCEAFLNPDQESSPFQHEARSDVVEASRWLSRQRELYRKQKLTLLQVHLIKKVLGVKLSRQYSPTRRNKHSVLKDSDAEFQRRG